MYISKIELTDIRCFKHIEIDLWSGDQVRKWTVVLGDNGVGKTTLLRSIAMGLGDRESAAALLRDTPGEWVRRQSPNREGNIRIEFYKDADTRKHSLHTEMTILNENGRESIVKHKPLPEKFPWDDIFVCGYGAVRGVSGTVDYEKYRTIDSVYTLFDYEMPLQNAELTLRRIQSEGADLQSILESIDKILMLPSGSTKLGKSGITISGPWGKFMPVASVADGYRATLAWVLDFLGWAMFYHDSIVEREKLGGIVLLDEIEQHLHPRWQRRIIELIHEQFKNTQFISTTHSPLCASGLADLPDDNCRLLLLELSKEKHHVSAKTLSSLRGLRADQALTSSAFGLPESRNFETEQKLEQFQTLLLKKTLDSKEKAELLKIREFFQEELSYLAEREEDRLLERNLRKWIIDTLGSQSYERAE